MQHCLVKVCSAIRQLISDHTELYVPKEILSNFLDKFLLNLKSCSLCKLI